MRLLQELIVLPVVAQVLVTIAVLVVLAVHRRGDIRASGEGPESFANAPEEAWSPAAMRASRCYRNQFEFPVLFYAVCGFVLATRSLDLMQFALAWLFVASRCVQAGVHMADGPVILRGLAFLVGVGAVALLWARLVVEIAATSF